MSECGFVWPLEDPSPEDEADGNEHHCVLGPGHGQRHRCLCGEPGPWD